MEFRDYYSTLGVDRIASQDAIKKAYRKQARQYHPDVNHNDPAAEQRFKEVNEAYEVLGNAETRKKYDELGANWKKYERARAAGRDPFAGGGPGGFRRTTTGGRGGGFRSVSEEELRDLFGGAGGGFGTSGGGGAFSDFFQAFFGGGGFPGRAPSAGGRRPPRAQKGRDTEHAMELTLEQAFRGVTQRLMLSGDGGDRTVEVRIPAGVPIRSARARVATSTFAPRFRLRPRYWGARWTCRRSMAGRCASRCRPAPRKVRCSGSGATECRRSGTVTAGAISTRRPTSCCRATSHRRRGSCSRRWRHCLTRPHERTGTAAEPTAAGR